MKQRLLQTISSKAISCLFEGLVSFPRLFRFAQAALVVDESTPPRPTSAQPRAGCAARLWLAAMWAVVVWWLWSCWSEQASDGERVVRRPEELAAREMTPEAAEAISRYEPRNPDPLVVAALPMVMPASQRWVAATKPQALTTATTLMSLTVRYTAWAWNELGTVDPAILMTIDNIEHWSRVVNCERKNTWQHNTRTALRGVARAVNPGAWAMVPPPIPDHRVVQPPYCADEEEGMIDAARMPRPRSRTRRIWIVTGCMGAGMSGGEVGRTQLEDFVERSDGSLAVHVRDPAPRLVPIRERYSGLAREVIDAVAANGGGRVIPGNPHAAFHLTRSMLGDHRTYPGIKGFSFIRGRNTWLTAHMMNDTPTRALRALAGRLSHQTLDRLEAMLADKLTPEEAVELGMGA